MYEFDPAPSDSSLRKAFDVSVTRCEVCWRQTTAARPTEKTYRELDTAFDQFASFLRNKAADPLPFFQVLKWIRERSTYRRPNPDHEPQNVQSVTWSIIWAEVYLETCFHGLRMGLTRWNLLAVQKSSKELLVDDRKFFLAPYPRHSQEAEKLALRLKHGLRNVPEFIAVQRARRRDNRFAAYAGLDLLDELQVRDLLNQIQRARESRPGEVSKMVIQVLSEHAAFQDRYRIGQNVMDDFTIVWIEKDDPYRRTRAPLDDKVIIEFHNRDCTLFRTNSAGLGRLVKSAFYKTLARNAQALTVFMLAYLELIGLVVDVITAGVAGGFRRVLFELVTERIKEKAVDAALDKLGVDHPVVRTVAGMGANLVNLPTKTRVPGKPDPDFNPKKQRAEALDKGSTLYKIPSARKAPANENVPVSRSPGGEVDTPDQGIIGMDAYKQRQQARQRAEEAKRAAEIAEANRMNQHARMSRASGDLGGGRAGSGHVDSDVSAPSTGGRSSGTSGSSGSSTGSSRPSQKERTLQSVPDLPVPPRNVRSTPMNQLDTVRDFYDQNVKAYPRHIKQMIRDLPQPGTRAIAKEDLVRIDAAIRQEHTDIANRLAGHARSHVKPFVMSGRSTANEGGMFAMLTTDQKHLSLHGQLKSGAGTVEFDSVEFRSSNIVETKMNLYRKTDDQVYDQMLRQATFASDWKFGKVTWEVWHANHFRRAYDAQQRLLHEFPRLGSRVEVVDPNNPWPR